MNKILVIIFIIYVFIIFWAMIGYPLSLRIIYKFSRKKLSGKVDSNFPNITILVVAHNEEKVIKNKLINLMNLSYPKNKTKILVSSDNSNDKTNEIVEEFINENKQLDISLYKVKKRKGKTNAQNEAVKMIKTEYIVFTDANSMLEKNAVNELISSFTSEKIGYVCGSLVYTNSLSNKTANLETRYWNGELNTRLIESNLQTIIAGNGALYALKKCDYIDIDLVESHDSLFPYHFALQNRRAIYNPNAIVYEKAGENIKDEFSRKIRIRRKALSQSIIKFHLLNIFKYKWYTYFYIGHRYFRDILWLSHFVIFILNIVLSFEYLFFSILLVFHLLFYFIAFVQHFLNLKNKIFNYIHYYSITILAQFIGVIKQLTGKTKPFWDKVESTR